YTGAHERRPGRSARAAPAPAPVGRLGGPGGVRAADGGHPTGAAGGTVGPGRAALVRADLLGPEPAAPAPTLGVVLAPVVRPDGRPGPARRPDGRDLRLSGCGEAAKETDDEHDRPGRESPGAALPGRADRAGARRRGRARLRPGGGGGGGGVRRP